MTHTAKHDIELAIRTMVDGNNDSSFMWRVVNALNQLENSTITVSELAKIFQATAKRQDKAVDKLLNS